MCHFKCPLHATNNHVVLLLSYKYPQKMHNWVCIHKQTRVMQNMQYSNWWQCKCSSTCTNQIAYHSPLSLTCGHKVAATCWALQTFMPKITSWELRRHGHNTLTTASHSLHSTSSKQGNQYELHKLKKKLKPNPRKALILNFKIQLSTMYIMCLFWVLFCSVWWLHGRGSSPGHRSFRNIQSDHIHICCEHVS